MNEPSNIIKGEAIQGCRNACTRKKVTGNQKNGKNNEKKVEETKIRSRGKEEATRTRSRGKVKTTISRGRNL